MTVLNAPGHRQKVELEEAEEILKRWQDIADSSSSSSSSSSCCTAIDLSCRVWTVPVLQTFTDFLKQQVTITDLWLDDIIASLPTEEGLETYEWIVSVFESNPNIRILHLNDNALGIRGMHILQPLWTKPSLHELHLCNCGISVESVTILAQHMTTTSLHVLDVGRNALGTHGAHAVSNLIGQQPNLHVFRYNGCRPLTQGTLDICQGLLSSCASQLHELNLDDCSFGTGDKDDDPVHTLCQVLSQATQLQILILNDGGLEAEGFAMVAEALQTAQAPLQVLDLGALSLGVEGAQVLADLLMVPSSVPMASTLHELGLESNDLTNEGLAILVPALQQCPHLHILNLNENDISDIQLLVDTKMESLQTLWIKDNEIDDEEQVETLKGMYATVYYSDEDDDKGETTPPHAPPAVEKQGGGGDDLLDDLTKELGATHI